MHVEARLEGARAIVRLSVARQRDEPHVPRPRGALAPDAPGDLVAVEAGQADIDDRDIGPRLARAVEPLGAAAREEDLVVPRAEEHPQGLTRVAAILDDEHALGPHLMRRRRHRRLFHFGTVERQAHFEPRAGAQAFADSTDAAAMKLD